MSTVLVTGASGLLGRQLIANLVSAHKVYGVSRNLTASEFGGCEFIGIDLAAEWSTDLLPKDIDCVIHLAQSEKFRDFPHGALDVFNVNLASTAKLLDFSFQNNVSKFILASTGGIYRRGQVSLTSESSLEAPDTLSQYFGTKLSSEIFANNYREYFEIEIHRIFFMYGPNQKSRMFLPNLVRRIYNGDSISLAGQNGIQLNPIYVDDVAEIIKNSIEGPGSRVLNVGGGEVYSIRQIANLIGEELNKTPVFAFEDATFDLIADSSAAKSTLGRDFLDLRTGIKRMISSMSEIEV